ncbi:hypothetical protein [Thermovibrio ammonificans]|uniref:Uncharacterized protein n=1 Tax=Thermovibrio ammonificans (strain DSM 15698 / JCM 12110 / HB-1) TaxID=648996 RepID=E8T4P5_THEA1|nr:hypothetical protein [Thermovibrio ammonificans]ADU97503.1 hypothetical protein Theam_1543 [Thermovibrio ammonificans HB-1]
MKANNLQTVAEEKFREWLDKMNYPYLYIEQSINTFSKFFKGTSKRPDFLIIVKNFGIIAVDVKEKKPYGAKLSFTLDEKNEVEKYIEFERLTRLPVWFVFCAKGNYDTWYWIPLSRVLSCKQETNNSDGSKFRVIEHSDCIIIQPNKNDGISRLIE